MAASYRYARKIITAFCLAVIFSSAAANSGSTLPTAEDINCLAEKAKSTADTFMQESFGLRLGYEYSRQFLTSQDKDSLAGLAKKAGETLKDIAVEQKQLKDRIELYQGSDWDTRYGQTGLWRKLFADLYTTILSRCEIDFYLALTADQHQRNDICKTILGEIDQLNQEYGQHGSVLIRGKVLVLLSQTDPAYRPLAIKQLESFKVYSDISGPVGAAIEQFKLTDSAEPSRLKELVNTLRQNYNDRYLELILQLLFLQHRFDPAGFEETIKIFPQTADFVGSLALKGLSHRLILGHLGEQDLQQISVFEADLAVSAAWKNKPTDFKTLLDCLCGVEKFQTPLILYVTAAAFADSSPEKAVTLLIKAGTLQRQQKSRWLDIEAEEIARQAAQSAYNLFSEEPNNCPLVLEAFENYFAVASGNIDGESEYLYSIVLNSCGRVQQGRILLQNIADRPASPWRNRAKLDLIIQQLQKAHEENTNQQNELLEQLRDFILACHGQDKINNTLRAEAMNIYCESLLESEDKTSAQKVLSILDKAETTSGIQYDLFKSKAFQQTGNLEKAAGHMLLAIRLDSGTLADQAIELLCEIIDKIDESESHSDNFSSMIQDCKKLAEFGNICLNNRQTALLLAEISVFAAFKDKAKLSEVEKLLDNLAEDGKGNDVVLLRCQARLLTEQAKFDQAAKLWAQICRIQKSETDSANQRSWKWWRAKFYELYCLAEQPDSQKENILHTIDVLENSFPGIPSLWAEKLSLLKEQCGGQRTNIRN